MLLIVPEINIINFIFVKALSLMSKVKVFNYDHFAAKYAYLGPSCLNMEEYLSWEENIRIRSEAARKSENVYKSIKNTECRIEGKKINFLRDQDKKHGHN